jgi:hypothetical protein
VFIHASLELPIPVANAVERLCPELCQQRLVEASGVAYQAGIMKLSRVGPFGDVRLLSKAVRVEMLEPLPVQDGVRVQFRWVATGVTGQLFPMLDADLDIIACDEQGCVLSIRAVYTPPLGPGGAGVDRLILHRVARSTMRSLLRGLGRSLTDPAPTAVPPATRTRLGRFSFSPTLTGNLLPEE